MCKLDKKNGSRRIDPCMKNLIENLKLMIGRNSSLKIVACCCGHFKYPMTIIVHEQVLNRFYDLVSSKRILRKKKFYKKDKQGYYFIPETIKK